MKIIDDFYLPSHPVIKNKEGIASCIQALQGSIANKTFAVIADFDRTLTGCFSSSWNALGDSGLFSREYMEKKESDYKKYRPYELGTAFVAEDEKHLSSQELKNKYMMEWWLTHLELLIEHGKGGKQKLDTIAHSNLLQWRQGAQEFVELLYQKDIPLIVVSAGVEYLITDFFQFHDLSHPLLSIESNILQFNEQGDIVGLDHDHVIHSANKSMIQVGEKTQKLLQGKRDFFILGDSKDDIDMASLDIVKKQAKNVLTVGIKTTEGSLEMFDDTGFHMVTTNEDYSGVRQLFDYILNENI